MTKNSWRCILVARFCINYTYLKFLDDKYRKKDHSFILFSSGLSKTGSRNRHLTIAALQAQIQ